MCQKPNPKIFEIALQRAKCEANKAIMIGDRIDNDIMPAKKNGNANNMDKTRLWRLLANNWR
ncbi:HAD-IA family hydrolase [Sellimonas intestinalis]|uniref:HAD-IA family hydrolase n=1 Tax=Sellimonas intestinalis TaxID=1653434 RepID=UPI0039A1A5F9